MSCLVLDIGNTKVKAAIVTDSAWTMLPSRTNLTTDWLKKIFIKHNITKVIRATVRQDDPIISDWLLQNTPLFVEFATDLPLPITIKYTTPHTLGKDRLAAVLGAWQTYPHQNTLVIDAGTCIKYDIITAEGNYLGGSIAPGIRMRLRAMHEFTARLPLVERQLAIPDFIGDSTETALRTGGQLAAALEAKGFVELYRSRFAPLNVVLTGGDAMYLKPYLPDAIVDNTLIMRGLYSVIDNY